MTLAGERTKRMGEDPSGCRAIRDLPERTTRQRGKSALAEACPETSKPRRGGDELLRETLPKPVQRTGAERSWRVACVAAAGAGAGAQAGRVVGGCGWKASGGRQSNEGRCEEEPEEWWLDLDMCRNRQCCSRRVIRGGGVSSSRSGPKGDSVHLDLHGCMGTPPPTHEDRRGGPTAARATAETEVHARSGVEFVQRRMGGHGRLRLPFRDARRACM